MEQLKFGLVGVSARGFDLLKQVLLPMEDIAVVAVCDRYEDRVVQGQEKIQEESGIQATGYTDYQAMLQQESLDAVLIATAWDTHVDIAIACMESGVAVACEVGGAYSVEECWQLVRCYEKTKTPIMMMENCCYGRNELLVSAMVQKGLFGEIVHCEGGYCHDLRKEVAFGKENRHYRLDNYLKRNGENYPTHELGPIAQLLDINRGNRMLTLTSMSSNARGLASYIKEQKPQNGELEGVPFAQGDIVTTLIKCAGGQTIRLTLDTTLPRFYSRGFTVRGTKGMFFEDNQSFFFDDTHQAYDFTWQEQYRNMEQYQKEHEHPMWKEFLESGVHGGHGGMDWLEFADFCRCLKGGLPMPIDVYDMAAWRVITVLSEESIAMGSQPVAIPDFTRGKWLTR